MISEIPLRLSTAAVMIAIVMGGLFFLPNTLFAVLALLVMMLAVIELLRLNKCTRAGSAAILIVYMVFGLCAIYANLGITQLLFLLASSLFYTILSVLIFSRMKLDWIRCSYITAMIGTVLVFTAWWAIMFIKVSQGAFVLLEVMGLVWLGDSGAYFVGKKCGKRKLAPAISPGKTIEGLIGAIIVGLIYISIMYALGYGFLGNRLWVAYLAGIALIVVSVGGDLLESQLKRQADQKDSGNLLPGHGGFLDRVDSLIAVLPVYACLSLLLVL